MNGFSFIFEEFVSKIFVNHKKEFWLNGLKLKM